MRWILNKTLFFLITREESTENRGIQYEVCKPYMAVIIWDTFTREKSTFFDQRTFISQFINEMPDDCIVQLKIFGTNKVTSESFTKVHKDETWKGKIADIEPIEKRNIPISDEHLQLVFDKLNIEISEQYFFIVNEYSEIEEDIINTLQGKKTSVAYSGNEDPPNVWTEVSTRRDHLININNYKVDSKLNPFSKIACEDSLLVCDTDMYWNGDRCYRCSYIFSTTPSEFCIKECPYYTETDMNKPETTSITPEMKTSKHETIVCDNSNVDYKLNWILGISIASLIFLLITCQFIFDWGV